MTGTLSQPTATGSWHDRADRFSIDGRPVINGGRVNALSGQTHPKTNLVAVGVRGSSRLQCLTRSQRPV